MNLVYQSIGAFLLVVALLSHQPCLATNEQQAPNFQEATSVVPDDFEDVLYQDAQVWIALHWEWRDTGVVTQEMLDFRFTYEEHLPKGWTPFATAYDLFERLYYHRLQLDPDLGPTYGLDHCSPMIRL